MASLLGERLFEISGQGPSPPKDFFQLVITKNEVTYLYGKFDNLERLPDDIMLRIMSYLELKETALLVQVSRRFTMLFNSEKLWEQTVRNCAGYLSRRLRAMPPKNGVSCVYSLNQINVIHQAQKKEAAVKISKLG
uniref:F-box domain-containing protein n=1 Tax=Amphilophus citrinellus TaxID=61819 RepID=A0A3Q0RYG7_AMPCI